MQRQLHEAKAGFGRERERKRALSALACVYACGCEKVFAYIYTCSCAYACEHVHIVVCVYVHAREGISTLHIRMYLESRVCVASAFVMCCSRTNIYSTFRYKDKYVYLVYAYTCVYIHAPLYFCIRECVRMQLLYVYKSMSFPSIRVYTYIYIYIRIDVHTHTHRQKCACI